MEEAAEEHLIKKIIKILSLDKRSIFDQLFRRGSKYEYLSVFGGILLHVKGQGVVWLPRSYIEGLLSKAGLSSVMIHKISLIFSFTVPGGGFLGFIYDFFKDRVWKKPPAEPRQYLPNMIDRVEYGSFTVNPGKINVVMQPFKSLGELAKRKENIVAQSLKSIVKSVKKEERAEEKTPFCIYFLRFIDKIAVAKENEKRFLKGFTDQVVRKFQRIPTFKCRDEQKLSKFVHGVERNGFTIIKDSKTESS